MNMFLNNIRVSKGLHFSLEWQVAQKNISSFIVQNIPISLWERDKKKEIRENRFAADIWMFEKESRAFYLGLHNICLTFEKKRL